MATKTGGINGGGADRLGRYHPDRSRGLSPRSRQVLPLGELIGESSAIEAVRRRLMPLLRLPPTSRRPPSILALGETGTGKGLLARALHRAGPRVGGPFVEVNCAALPGTLLEAELFGFARGAFTGARTAKPGLFQVAHGGVILLDEVGALSLDLQVKLLTVIEDHAVRRLGSTEREPADVWLISATNDDLPAAVREGRFRSDLYHRLAAFIVPLPALRERDRDIVALAEYFLQRASNDYGLSPKSLSLEATLALQRYPWPGNVRELSNVMERAALLVEEPVITAAALGLEAHPEGGREPLRRGTAAAPSPRALAGRGPGSARGQTAGRGTTGSATLDPGRLLGALDESRWNLSRAAARLGIPRNTLRYRMAKYGLLRRGTSPASGAATVPNRGPEVSITLRWERRRLVVLGVAVETSRRSTMTEHGLEELPVPARDEPRLDRTGVLEVVVEKVQTFGGRIEELTSSRLLAAFGVEPLDDAAGRAAHAALAIMASLNRNGGDGPARAELRAAIHAGEFVVARVGTTTKIDLRSRHGAHKILDDLLGRAEPNTILASGPTSPFLDRRFALVPAEGADGAPNRPHRVIRPVRFGSAGPFQASFVERDDELEILQSRFGLARGGRGQAVVVGGDPGVGKSRLVLELGRRLGTETATILEEACSSHGPSFPYLPVVDLLRAYFGTGDLDGPNTVRESVTAKLATLGDEAALALPGILALLDASLDDGTLSPLEPRERRQRMHEALERFVVCLSRQRPVVLVLEDLHWCDSETQAFLDRLVQRLPSAAIFLIVTHRPEYTHRWLPASHVTEMRLAPLTATGGERLLTEILGSHPGLAPVKQLLAARSQGNPFFMEEGVRTLVETGELVGEPGAYRAAADIYRLQMPDTVEDMLGTRLHRLPQAQRDLLLRAAVLGMEGPIAILRTLVDLDEETLRDALAHLRTVGFLGAASGIRDPLYAFKHALIHEAVYASLVPAQQTAVHSRIVDIIEDVYADRLPEHLDRLAHHTFHGARWEKAVAYLRRAGARALAGSASREAAVLFARALAALAGLAESREVLEQAVDIRLELQSALVPLGELGRILDSLREAEAFAETLADEARIARVATHMTHCLWWTGRPDQAVEQGRRALDIAERGGDVALQVATSLRLGQAYFSLAQFRETIDLLEPTMRLLDGALAHERFGQPILPAVHCRVLLAYCFESLGAFTRALRTIEDGVAIAEATRHPYTLAVAYGSVGTTYVCHRRSEEATPWLERGLDVVTKAGFPGLAPQIMVMLGHAYALSGRASEGGALLQTAAELTASIGLVVFQCRALACLAEARLLGGRIEEALDVAQRAQALAREHRQRWVEPDVLRILGSIHAVREPFDDNGAAGFYLEALAQAKELGMRPLEALCHLDLGKLYRRTGPPLSATAHLKAAIAVSYEAEMPACAADAKNELEELGHRAALPEEKGPG